MLAVTFGANILSSQQYSQWCLLSMLYSLYLCDSSIVMSMGFHLLFHSVIGPVKI